MALVAVLVAGVVALMALVGVAAPAGAQYVPGQPGIVIDPPELPETGGTANIKGFGCSPNTKVDAFIVVDGQEIFIGTSTSADDDDGSFTIPVTIPRGTPGEYTILAKCGSLTLSTILTLTPVGTAAVSNGKLPVTGSDTANLVRVAALLIAGGGFAALMVRKRRNSLSH